MFLNFHSSARLPTSYPCCCFKVERRGSVALAELHLHRAAPHRGIFAAGALCLHLSHLYTKRNAVLILKVCF